MMQIELERENNEYFIDWIYKIWKHHDTIDKLYQCNYDTKIEFGEKEFYYKILLNNQMIGFLGLDLKDDKILDKHTLYINRFFINEEFRNKGIGENIINQLIEIARSMNRDLELDVYGNNPAIHIYEKMGFKINSKNMILKIESEKKE